MAYSANFDEERQPFTADSEAKNIILCTLLMEFGSWECLFGESVQNEFTCEALGVLWERPGFFLGSFLTHFGRLGASCGSL